jgi:hypothetical protein
MKPKYLTDLKELRLSLELEAKHVQDLNACILEECEDEFSRSATIERQISELREDQEALHAAARQRAKNLYGDLAIAESRQKRAHDAIKRFCHSSLPLDVLEKGLAVGKDTAVSVRVNKVQVVRSYDADRMALEHPELEEMYLEGDPVIGRTIVPEVLERLVSMGRFDEEDAAKYRVDRKAKNPSVYIKVNLEQA